MKKILLIFMTLTLVFTFVGCKSQNNNMTFPSDEEIMEQVKPYLTNAVEIDLSEEDSLGANLGLTKKDVTEATFYLGAPNQNTTYFCMITLAEDADIVKVKKQIESVMNNWVATEENGYISGYSEYEIIQKGNKIFAVMHENQKSFEEICTYLNGLPEN